MSPSEADMGTAREFIEDRASDYCGEPGCEECLLMVHNIAQLIANERERIGGWLALLGLDINEVVVPREKQS